MQKNMMPLEDRRELMYQYIETNISTFCPLSMFCYMPTVEDPTQRTTSTRPLVLMYKQRKASAKCVAER